MIECIPNCDSINFTETKNKFEDSSGNIFRVYICENCKRYYIRCYFQWIEVGFDSWEQRFVMVQK